MSPPVDSSFERLEGGANLAIQLLDRIRPGVRSKDVPTLMVALQLLVLLLPYVRGSKLTETLRSVVLLLGHRFPKVRKSAADLFYVHLLTYGDPGELEPMADEESGISEEPMAAGDARLEVIMSALLETAWLGSLDQNAKPARAKVLSALGLPPPKVLAAAPAAPKKVEEDTYKELVGEMGY